MSTSYTAKSKFGKPAPGDRGWSTTLLATIDAIDGSAPVSNLAVTRHETPSATLTVDVAAGSYLNSGGAKVAYAGVSAQAIPTATTKVLYILDSTGALTLGTSYPTTVAHIPLATVVAGASTITSVTDDRIPGARVMFTLGNYANDTAAAGGGIPIGGLYRNGSVVQVRVS